MTINIDGRYDNKNNDIIILMRIMIKKKDNDNGDDGK
jgi:hypothetical protein